MADPWDWEPWRRLALLESLRWKLSRSSEAAENALWFSSQAIERRPELHAAWFEHGGYQLEFGDAAKAVESFARGVELYPNHAAGHAHLAMALAAAGEAQRAADEAREALRLDETTPHLDQKLPRQPVDLYAQCEELARE
jgi:tetratricopeptide (TPR) repeat protein